MTPISNQLTYSDLLLKYQPKPIKTQQDYEQALSVIEGMMSRTLTKDEEILFELLVLLIEAYEQQYYLINKTNPTATLESLIYEFDVNYESIIDIFGDIKALEAIMTQQQEISQSQAESLAEFFNHLSPKLGLTSHNFL